MDEARISRQLLGSDYVLLRMYDLLLKVAPRECHGAHMPIQPQHTSRCGRRELETANMNVGYTQQGTPMKGIQRLIVLDRCPSVTIADIPQVWSCGERKVRGATRAPAQTTNRTCPDARATPGDDR